MTLYKSGHYKAFKTEIDTLLLVKTKSSHDCAICKKEIPKGSYCLGKNYRWSNCKTCLDCAESYLTNFIISVENLKMIGVEILNDIQKNKKTYETANQLAKI